MQRILPWLAAAYLANATAPLVVRCAHLENLTPHEFLERARRKLPIGRVHVSDRARLKLMEDAQRRARLERREVTLMDQKRLWEAQRKREDRIRRDRGVAARRLAPLALAA